MKQKSVKGMKCFLMYDPVSEEHFIRKYEDDRRNFTDYGISHYDLQIQILDNDAVIRQNKTGSSCIDYSNKTLGIKDE